MRTLSFILIFVLLISCKKSNDFSLSSQLNGKWELRQITNFSIVQFFAPGNNVTIEFKGNLKYTRNDSTGIRENGSYRVVVKKDCYGDEKKSFITFSSGLADNFYYIEDSSLVFYTSNCVSDGGVVTYRKIQ